MRAIAGVPRGGIVLLAGPEFRAYPELIDRILNASPRQSGEVWVRTFIGSDQQLAAFWPPSRFSEFRHRVASSLYLLLAMTDPPDMAVRSADLVLRWNDASFEWRIEVGARRE